MFTFSYHNAKTTDKCRECSIINTKHTSTCLAIMPMLSVIITTTFCVNFRGISTYVHTTPSFWKKIKMKQYASNNILIFFQSYRISCKYTLQITCVIHFQSHTLHTTIAWLQQMCLELVRLCKTLRKRCTKFHQNRLNFTGDITKKHFGLSPCLDTLYTCFIIRPNRQSIYD